MLQASEALRQGSLIGSFQVQPDEALPPLLFLSPSACNTTGLRRLKHSRIASEFWQNYSQFGKSRVGWKIKPGMKRLPASVYDCT